MKSLKTQTRLVLFVAALLAVTVSPLHAQIVADGATNTLSNVTNSIPGSVIVGTNGSFTLLVLSDNALVTNSAHVVIGANATAKSNEVRLISSTSRWRMGGSLFVGSNGASSRLVVSNGALLEDFDGNLGFRAASSNNSALVTGPGTLWTNQGSFGISSGFLVNSSSNRLVVSDGAALLSGGTAGVGGFGSQVLITGPGSRWASQSDFTFGGTRNALEVSDGAALVTSSATITDLTSGDTDTILLTGTGTVWTNSQDLIMGYAAHGVVTASNGAAVFIGGRASIGALSGSNSNTVWVTDSGTRCTIGSDLYIGTSASASLLVVSNGGFLFSSNAVLGSQLGGSVNSAVVVGAGSVWSNRNLLYIGGGDHDNQLVVSGGAALVVGGPTSLGTNFSATANTATVTGPGSAWTNSGVLKIGDASAGNRLVVSNGARLESSTVHIAFNSSSRSNEAVVTGPGSSWNALASVTIGDQGSGNRFVVSNGGRMRSVSTSTIGFLGTNNLALVTGAGSSWSNLALLNVGFGNGNQLVVSNQGIVFTRGVLVGAIAGATNNRVVVDGGTLMASNAGVAALEVRLGTNVFNGGLIDVDQLLMTNAQGKFEYNGGTLVTRGAVIANGAPFVVGTSGTTPAIWDVRAGVTNTFVGGELYIGSNSSFNQLILTNGALLTNSTFTLMGREALARSNSVTLAGASSRWWLDDGVTVGVFGSANQLVISNGASLVTGSSSSIGNEFISSNNEAAVTGPGSSWTSGLGHLFVGGGGRNNRLLVSEGGQVFSFIGRIGYFFADTTNNVATVTGSGSLWSNATELYVGDSGARNLLVVSNSGTVLAGSALYLGFASTSTNNRVLVDGGTLRVTNVSATGTLDVRRGIFTQNSGLVEVDRLLVTNTLGSYFLNGGTLSSKSTTFNSSAFLDVGNNIGPATFLLAGNGTHVFGSLEIDATATLTGNGTVGGPIVALNGSTISPGTSIGKMTLTNPPFLFGTILMEISKTGSVLTNDQIQVTGALTYGGTLTVTNIGPNALVGGNQFQLFSATSYSSSFTTISLPPLAPGLYWTNKLLVNGSIQVIGIPLPGFATISVSGTNVIVTGTNGPPSAPYAVLTTTNVALPMSNWVSLVTNQFDSNGNFSFTNAIAPGIPKRFYRTLTLYD